jgi:serine/threonine-protein kinase
MAARSDLPVEEDPPSAAPLAPGEVLAEKYRIEEIAGKGGMAVVYAAHHLVLDQRVAVKVLVAQGARDEVTTQRFVREAQAAARLQSEHAVRVMDAGVLPTGQPFLVMEYLEGCDLAELLVLSGPIEIPELVDYMLQALEGIAHAHAAHIVHRDVKPSNLFITVRPDGSNIVKVLDFGISKSTVEPVDRQTHKLTGNAVLGSPAYMSPEQVRNASGVDGRSDVWSLGVSMYELLTGQMPFDGDGVGAMLAAILEADPVPVHELRPQVPRALSDAVARCLRRPREERWPDVGDLARAIAPFGSGTWAAYPERIAATLVNARQLRPPTPLGAFTVTPLSGQVTEGEGDSPSGTLSWKGLAAEGGIARSVASTAQEDADRKAITHSVRRPRRSSRWFAIPLAALAVAGGVGLAVTRAHDEGAAAAPEASPPPWTAPSASAVLFVASPAAAPSARASAAPADSLAGAAASASTGPAASAHRPAHKGTALPSAPGASRPLFLHSRN